MSHFSIHRPVILASLAAILVVGLPVTANAGTDSASELSKVASMNNPNGSTWAINLKPGNISKRVYKVVGAGEGETARVRTTTVSPGGVVSWKVGTRELGSIILKSAYRAPLKKASLDKVRFVDEGNEPGRYKLVNDAYPVDSTARLDAVAQWLSATGPVEHTTKQGVDIYSAVRDPNIVIPVGVAAAFYPDGKNNVEVSVRVKRNVIQGYTFTVRADREIRVLDASRTTAPRVLQAPSASEVSSYASVFNALAAHDAPKNIVPSVISKVRPGKT